MNTTEEQKFIQQIRYYQKVHIWSLEVIKKQIKHLCRVIRQKKRVD